MWYAVPRMKSRLHYSSALWENIPTAATRFFYGFINGLCDFTRQVGFSAKADW